MNKFSSGLRQPNTTRPQTAAVGSTGGLQKQDLNSSSDRINQYQNKLSSMREKFQARKSAVDGGGQVAAEAGGQQDSGQKPPSGGIPLTKHSSAGLGGKQNLNTSFSAMNSSLQQKWKAMQGTKNASARGEQFQANAQGRVT